MVTMTYKAVTMVMMTFKVVTMVTMTYKVVTMVTMTLIIPTSPGLSSGVLFTGSAGAGLSSGRQQLQSCLSFSHTTLYQGKSSSAFFSFVSRVPIKTTQAFYTYTAFSFGVRFTRGGEGRSIFWLIKWYDSNANTIVTYRVQYESFSHVTVTVRNRRHLFNQSQHANSLLNQSECLDTVRTVP